MAQLPDNTFIQDFQIANAFGEEAIKDTYNRCQEWRNDVGMWAALCYALNYWCWSFYENGDQHTSKLYCYLYYQAIEWGNDNFKGEDFSLFYELTD